MATINDVAKMAGVSAMTVSRVLNQTGNVLPQKRERVLQAIVALGYQPNLVARSLATNKSNTVGMICTVMANAIYPAYMEGACDRLRKEGLDVIVYYAKSFEQALSGAHTLLSKQVDGLILLPLEIHNSNAVKREFTGALSDALTRSGKPIATIGNLFLKDIAGVAEDYRAGAQMAVRHLHEMGHKQIGYLKCDAADYPWNERNEGFARALRELDLPLNKHHVLAVEECHESIVAAVRAWARQNRSALPTALYCANDMFALCALSALAREGIRVPEDISLIGHDGITYAAYSYPRISTIALSPHETGQAAAQELLNAMQGASAKPGHRSLMRPRLAIGETVKPIRA